MNAPPPPHDDARLRDFREALREARYEAQAIREALQGDESALSRPWERTGQLERLEERGDALSTLALLFTLNAPVAAGRVDRLLAPLTAQTLDELRLLRVEGESAVPLVKIVPHDDVLVVSDIPDDEAPPDFVASVHRPSHTLASLTVRRQGERVLDMGTGNGIQALLAARHAGHVVATDVNERALDFARVSAVLNDAGNIEFRNGSFFEPVEGERFDLVVTNPPYVISPDSAYLFRDSGMARDSISEHVVRELPGKLVEGGFGSVMVSWIVDGDDPAARPREWLEGSGCDAWILLSAVEDPISTATAWNRSAGTPEQIDARVRAWLGYYREQGISALAYATVVMRRRQGANWVRETRLPAELGQASGQLQRMFAAQETLDRDDGTLLAARYAFVDGARLSVRHAPDRGWRFQEATLALEDGMGFAAGLDAPAAAIVSGLAPDRTLDAVLGFVAKQHGLDRASVRSAGAHLLRNMLELGFVEPV